MSEEKSKIGRLKASLIAIGALFGLMVLAVILSPEKSHSSGSSAEIAGVGTMSADPRTQIGSVSESFETIKDDTARGGLVSTQSNASRSAEQYLSMPGFSREGLIQQLSSDAGDGYSVADATTAVDSLSVDWNENAVKSAKQYLSMSGFSCQGLIQQLSSDAGDKYTVDQATYGANQAGAC